MIWLVVALGVVAVVGLMIAVAVRRGSFDGPPLDEVDPLFTTGIALTGAGVALATTLGNFMYGVMIVGLVVMAIGASRTNQRRHHG